MELPGARRMQMPAHAMPCELSPIECLQLNDNWLSSGTPCRWQKAVLRPPPTELRKPLL